MDIYLQPHSDDVCFSLAGLADRRRAGVLLTVCPVTGYVALRPGDVAPPAQTVTALRMAEDEAFCRASGLAARALDLPCSSLLGYRPFDLSRADENRKRIEEQLLGAVLALAEKEDSGARSWLFCPCGVGGHVDHVAVFDAIMGNYRRLSARFHIAFYETLRLRLETQGARAQDPARVGVVFRPAAASTVSAAWTQGRRAKARADQPLCKSSSSPRQPIWRRTRPPPGRATRPMKRSGAKTPIRTQFQSATQRPFWRRCRAHGGGPCAGWSAQASTGIAATGASANFCVFGPKLDARAGWRQWAPG